MVQNSFNTPDDRSQSMRMPVARRHGMTVVEIVAVVGIIILLMGILLPALGIASGNAKWAKSQSNMRQIYGLMQEYTTDNREIICPAAFDYRQSGYPGKVRSAQPAGAIPPLDTAIGQRLNYGTWTDILWTYGDFSVPKLGGGSGGGAPAWNYRYDSPDRAYYQTNESYDSIFRAALKPTITPRWWTRRRRTAPELVHPKRHTMDTSPQTCCLTPVPTRLRTSTVNGATAPK